MLGLLVAAPLALGGVHPPVRFLAMVLAVGSLVVWGIARARDGLTVTFGWWGGALAVGCGAALLQLLPLPVGVVEVLAPERFSLAREIAGALGEDVPGWMSLGLDRVVVAYGLAGLTLHLAVFMWARHTGRAGWSRERFVIAIEVAAAVAVAVGVVHQLAGWDKLLGFYLPAAGSVGGPFPATFVNPNHFAALCLMAALLACGAAIGDAGRTGWHGAMGIIAAVGVFLSMSRANALLLVVGLAFVGLPWAFERVPDGESGDRRVRARRFLVGLGSLVFIAFVFVGPERWLAELEGVFQHPTSNVEALVGGCWGAGARVVGAYTWFGVGSGAMGLATPAFIDGWSLGLVTHAHNGLLEVLGELGVVLGGLVLLLAAGGMVAYARRAWRDPVRWGGLVVLLMGAIQNLVDFSWWIPGVGLGVAAVAGFVSSGGSRRAVRPVARGVVSRGGWVLVVGAAGVIGLVVGWPLVSGWRGEATVALEAGSDYDWRGLARARGADFLALGFAGALAERRGEVEVAERLAALAIARAPMSPEAIARGFKLAVARNNDEAAVALVEREVGEPLVGKHAAYELVLSARHREGILRAFFGVAAERVLEGVRRLEQVQEREAARELLTWGVAQFPDEPLLVEAFGARLPGGAEDLEALGRLATRALSKAGGTEDAGVRAAWERVGYFLEGRRSMARGRHAEAWSLFMGAVEASKVESIREHGDGDSARARFAVEGRVLSLTMACAAAYAVSRVDQMEVCVKGLEAEDDQTPRLRGALHLARSRWRALAGETRLAIRELQAAIQHRPDMLGYHAELAELFEKSGDKKAAARERLRAKQPASP